ncbi:MAG: recombinase family protein [Christensenellales bacterium]
MTQEDLSRFGRDYIDTGKYLERILPPKGVRFIAINDGIDSIKGAYDMMLPIKNIFNSQYARDISGKIRSSFDIKRRQGEFIGAFCSYGYCKDPRDHNHLVIDEGAAKVVRRIYDMFESGVGKDSVARKLNQEGIPCPSEYKRMLDENYKNGLKLEGTTYWTYSTVHRMLRNRIYAGDMVQGKYHRPTMHGKAHLQEREKWVVRENTHEPIISIEQWERVQRLLEVKAKKVDFVSEDPLKGFIKCGKCGRSMVIRGKDEKAKYSCGSYERYGPAACPNNKIKRDGIIRIILDDLNAMLSRIVNVRELNVPESASKGVRITEKERLEKALERMSGLRRGVYEDYKAVSFPRRIT